MSSLTHYFDRIAIISLPDRADRRAKLLANLEQLGLAAAADLTWVAAVDGTMETLPHWWKAGAGAWGCRASQLATLTAAQKDGLERLLILEDDAVFHHRAKQWLGKLMPLLPVDWEMLFLGGQHMRQPAPTAHPALLRGLGISRTHAYAVHARAYASLIAAISDLSEYEANPSWHIDHQYAHGHSGRWKAYAPAWWLAAQEAGHSNIAAAAYPRRWWPPGNEYWHLPFIKFSEQKADNLNSNFLLAPSATSEPIPEDRMGRALWLRDLARKAWCQGRLPTCDLPPQEINTLWIAGHRAVADATELEQLADYPANNLFPHPFTHIDKSPLTTIENTQ